MVGAGVAMVPLSPGGKGTHPMPNKPKKADLPTKPCTRCGRPFAWRKKWAKVWAEVKYCSERCKKG